MTQFNIAITNCNSVDRAEVVLTKGTLNIKYGPNGLGKSTLAKAIVSKIRGDGGLQDLVPFKHRGNAEAAPPEVEGIDDLASALVFDDDYVQQFVFQKDEVLKNSFDIFIKTLEYFAAMGAIAALQDPILAAIYLRRDYELRDDVGLEYNLLASLFKGRAVPTLQSKTENRDMTPEEKGAAEASIREEHLPGFSYDALVAEVNDVNCIRAKFLATDVGYEKIQLFRVFNIDHDDDVIRKFINESYHIENEYVMQLNPHKFESIPEYVIEECVRLLPMSS
ncbi:hypothetical protein ACE103_07440 [Bradyrhizobium sp. ma5]|uniref:hypothetical protein n=1 Tax=Bradyrhizobium sp. ma5 TaxID=3344828 RepID=UPI0035D47209